MSRASRTFAAQRGVALQLAEENGDEGEIDALTLDDSGPHEVAASLESRLLGPEECEEHGATQCIPPRLQGASDLEDHGDSRRVVVRAGVEAPARVSQVVQVRADDDDLQAHVLVQVLVSPLDPGEDVLALARLAPSREREPLEPFLARRRRDLEPVELARDVLGREALARRPCLPALEGLVREAPRVLEDGLGREGRRGGILR